MKTHIITKDQLDEDNNYIGDVNLEDFDGNLECEEDLENVYFKSLKIKGSIIFKKGSGIIAGRGISAGSGIEAGWGISAGSGISAEPVEEDFETLFIELKEFKEYLLKSIEDGFIDKWKVNTLDTLIYKLHNIKNKNDEKL